MKNPLQKPSAQEVLLAALASNPDIAQPLATLTAAVEQFEAIRSKLSDDSVEAGAIEREEKAKAALVRAQALSEIGQATAADIDAARKELTAAREGLESTGGRKEVLTEELLKVQSLVDEAKAALAAAFDPWRADVRSLAVDLANEGLRLLVLATAASNQAGHGYPAMPRYLSDLGDVVGAIGFELYLPSPPSLSASLIAEKAFQVERRASRALDEKIAPEIKRKPPAPREAWAESWKAPGLPVGVDALALGDPNPAARRVS